MDGDTEEQKDDWLNNMVLFDPRKSNAIGEKVEHKPPTASAPTVEPAARSEPAAASVSEPVPQVPETSALVPAPAASAPVPVPAASAASAPVPAPAASKSATKRGLQQPTGETRGSRSKSIASPSVSFPVPVYTFHGRSDAVGPAAAAPTTDPVITLVAPTTPPEVIAPEGGSCTVDEYKYNANDLDRFCKTTRQAAIEVCNELQNNDITPGDKGTQPEPATGAGDRAKHLAGVMLLMRTIMVASAASAPMGAGASSQSIDWSSYSARSLPDGFHFEQRNCDGNRPYKVYMQNGTSKGYYSFADMKRAHESNVSQSQPPVAQPLSSPVKVIKPAPKRSPRMQAVYDQHSIDPPVGSPTSVNDAISMATGAVGPQTESVRANSSLFFTDFHDSSIWNIDGTSGPEFGEISVAPVQPGDSERETLAKQFMGILPEPCQITMVGGQSVWDNTPIQIRDATISASIMASAGRNGSNLKMCVKAIKDYARHAAEYDAPAYPFLPTMVNHMAKESKRIFLQNDTTNRDGHSIIPGVLSAFNFMRNHFGADYKDSIIKNAYGEKIRSSHQKTIPLPVRYIEDLERQCNETDLMSPIGYWSRVALVMLFTSSRAQEWCDTEPTSDFAEVHKFHDIGLMINIKMNKQKQPNTKCAIPKFGILGPLEWLPNFAALFEKMGHGTPALSGGCSIHTASAIDISAKVDPKSVSSLIIEVINSLMTKKLRLHYKIGAHSLHGTFDSIAVALALRPFAQYASGRWYQDTTFTYASREAVVYQFKVREHIINAVAHFRELQPTVDVSTPMMNFISSWKGAPTRFTGENAV